ncbi:hypothetical protein LIER_35614 [Lithospermum erythrorhizon]|uniref:Uncharacterized protein n=1 Tax=Lithospermum erythrorhizon TaxID=34254 RepID=A0AAV3NTK3_LITER
MKGFTLNRGATIPDDFYEWKKMLAPVYLRKHKIHTCVNDVMLYYNENEDLDSCIHCLELQADIFLTTQACSTFSHFGQFGRSYSSWKEIICVYNFPPCLCMKEPFVFMSLIIPSPKSPGRVIDVFLRSLVDELNDLWSVCVNVSDSYEQQNFQLRAAFMWTISDFPPYGLERFRKQHVINAEREDDENDTDFVGCVVYLE